MKRSACVLLVFVLIGLACSLFRPLTPTAGIPTAAPDLTATSERMVVCTPPPCAANEDYYCPGNCPGGCGTVCATHTPSPQTLNPPTTQPPAFPTPVDFPFPPDPSKYQLSQIAGGFTKPLLLTHAGDGSRRLFVVEQSGTIWIVADGATLPRPFLDIRDRVGSEAYEQGLLGLAFHPRYVENGYFYVNYTDTRGDTVVARYSVSADPNVADPGSEKVILTADQPYPNHNGGNLAFGPDGFLYIGLGDGGAAGDPENRAQNLNTLLGKMLRVDVDGGDPYAIPPDNPFIGANALPEIWAYGLRNPWRFSFDRATGDLYIGDVGQNAYEEIDYQPAGQGGANYGWNYLEGTHPYENAVAPNGLTPPIAEYPQSEGGCSVTGGYVYRGPELPELSGVYLFGDYCSGYIWALSRTPPDAWNRALMFESGMNISSFGEDEAGEVYVVDHNGGIYRVTASSP